MGIHPTATFTVARHELVGPDALLGPAEIARGVCRHAHRRFSLLAVTRARMRRIDGWLTDDALVTHPVATDAVIGTVCDARHAPDLVGAVIDALIGAIPGAPAPEPIDVDDIGALAPGTLPVAIDWLLLATGVADRHVARWASAGIAGGLVGARVGDPRRPVRLEPIGPLPTWSQLAGTLGIHTTPIDTVDANPTQVRR